MPNKIEKDAEGNLTVELETGEKFTGDPLAVTQKMAEAHVSTKRWGQEWKQKAETPPVVTPPPTDAANQEKQLQEYLLTQTAKSLGYNSGDEFKADLTRVKTSTAEIQKSTALQTFFTSHPEFPGTQQANDAIGKIFDEYGWTDMTSNHLHLAHLEAMNRYQRDPQQGYQALSEKEVSEAWAGRMSQSNRQPPPMLRGNSPDISQGGGKDAWNMPMNDLRAAAIKQQLEGK